MIMTTSTTFVATIETEASKMASGPPTALNMQRQQGRHSMDLFVKLPSQHSIVPITLQTRETVQDLENKVRKMLNYQRVKISVAGRQLTDKRQLRPQCTIEVALQRGGLFGGAKGDLEPVQGAGDGEEETFAQIITQVPDAAQIDLKEDCKLSEMIEQYESEFEEQKDTHKFIYFINNNKIEVNEQVLEKTLTELGHVAGAEIKVRHELKDTKTMSPEDALLSQVPYISFSSARRQFKALLSDQQKTLLKQYWLSEIDADEDIIRILRTMSDHQLDKLLSIFQHIDRDPILEYLLRKGDQWTEISKTVMLNSNDDTKDMQIRRLINKQQNHFDENDPNDRTLVQIFRSNQETLGQEFFQKNVSKGQKTEILMAMLEPAQRGKVIECLRVDDVSPFWSILSKERRMDCWANLSDELKFNFMVTDRYIIDDQKRRLWDNIGKDKRLEMWRLCKEEHVYGKNWCEVNSDDFMYMTAVKRIQQLQQLLFGQLTTVQQVRLWTNLDQQEQVDLINTITKDEDKAKEFWKMLNFDKRCLMVEQLELGALRQLFMMSDLENRTQMITMCNENTRTLLEGRLTEKDKRELFFYKHFNKREKTEGTSESFIDDMLDHHYEKHNQVVPFDRIEEGYVQCIHNPYVNNGFITVQEVEPTYLVDNTEFIVGADATEQELETDEARKVNAQKKEKNDMFRMTQNRYGHLNEEDPNDARNAKRLCVVSFYEYGEKMGMWCTHSFFVQNPIFMRRNGQASSEIFLFKSEHTNEIFFFNTKSLSDSGDENRFDLQIQIIQPELNPNNGELSREATENCFVHRIDKESRLYDYVMNGKYPMAEYQNQLYSLNPVPTIVSWNQEKFVVFSHIASKEQEDNKTLGPALYFYSLNKHRETLRIMGGEALIDFFVNPSEPEESRVLYLMNFEVNKMEQWKQGTQKEMGQRLGKVLLQPDSKSAKIAAYTIRWPNTQGQGIHDLVDVPDSSGLRHETHGNTQFFNTELQDDDGRFQERYLRNTPVQIVPHRRDTEAGITESFTLLFTHLYSFTFSFSLSQAMLRQQEEEKKKALAAAALAAASSKGKDDGAQEAEEEVKESKSQSVFGQIKEHMVYKCKYIVPDASEVIIDKRDPKSIKTLIQVSNNNARMRQKGRESLKDRNDFSLYLYNITDDKIKKGNVSEKLPSDTRTKVPISRNALSSYVQNVYGGKYGDIGLKTIACPILLTDRGYVGAFLYEYRDSYIDKKKLHWYEVPQYGRDPARVIELQTQTVQVDYPLMVYKGFVPDNREIVLVNLADKEQPQKIIHLYDKQFICFVGHNFSEREAKVGFLALDSEGEKVQLCWLICHQPFEKKKITDLVDYSVQETEIRFEVPILNKISTIKKAEYIKAPGDDNPHDGCLIIQTEDEIWFTSNINGAFKAICNGKMAKISMQRGYNSIIYFGEISVSGQDEMLMEMKMHIARGQWQPELLEIYTVREGNIIALEMDIDNRDKTDSVYTYNNQLIESREDVTNQLYFIDDKENMFKMRQRQEGESGNRYELLEERNLSAIRDLTLELNRFKQRPFNRVAVTARCLTLNDANFSFANSCQWKLNVQRGSRDATEDDKDDDGDDEEGQGQTSSHYDVHSIESISWTSRQLIQVSYQERDKAGGAFKKQDAFITKLQPGSRRQDLVGLRGLRDMESINMVSDDLYLLKFKASDLSGIQDYWSVLDKYGQIHPLPRKSEEHLTWSNFSSGQSRQKQSGCTLILKGGQSRILSLDADQVAEEREITTIEFNRVGEVTQTKVYAKDDYDASLRENILTELTTNPELQDEELYGRVFEEEQAKKTVETLQYADQVLVTKDNDLYRIASIVNPKFDDKVAINLLDDSEKEADWVDDLNMGLFIVKCQNEVGAVSARLAHDDKDLKIVLFLCKSERDRFHLHKAGFAICGKFLCWSYPEEKLVHILDMDPMNDLKREKKTVARALASLASVELDRALPGLLGVPGMPAMPGAPALGPAARLSAKSPKPGSLPAGIDDHFLRVGKDGSPQPKSQVGSPPPASQRALSPPPAAAKRFALNASVADEPSSDEESDGMVRRPLSRHSRTNTASSAGEMETTLAKRALDSTQAAVGKSILKPQSMLIDTSKPYASPGSILEESKGDAVKFADNLEELEPEIKQSASRVRVSQTLIKWQALTTRTIQLEVMMETNADAYSTHLAEVPHSTQLSIRKDEFGAMDIRDNLLQVAVRDKIIIYDISTEPAQEIFFFNATSQFIDPERYVESGIKMVECKEDPSEEKDGYLVNQIVTNRQKDICFLRQDKQVFNRRFRWDDIPRAPVCRGVFKKYAELDLQELKRISSKFKGSAKLDNIDLQTALCTFKDHTVFSIFSENTKFHQQVLTQVLEEEFPEEEQEDEQMLENNVLRRLYRILTMPTPDLEEPVEEEDEEEDEDEPGQPSAAPLNMPNMGGLNQPLNLPSLDEPGAGADKLGAEGEDEAQLETEQIEGAPKAGLNSVLTKSLYLNVQRVKDCLLTICNRCDECNISNFCENQDDFEVLLRSLNSNSMELIQDSFIRTPFTKKIVNAPWYAERGGVITFLQHTTIIREKDVEARIKTKLCEEEKLCEPSQLSKIQVDVRMLDLTWLLADKKNFVTFVNSLQYAKSEQIYTTELIDTLLETFWQENYDKIVRRCLLPWVAYAVLTLAFFSQALQEDHLIWLTVILGLLALGGLGFQVYIEISQQSDAAAYFTNLQNYVDMFQFLSAAWIIVFNVLSIETPSLQTQRVVASLTSFCLWIKVLDFLRLFGETSFYIKLIFETVRDIQNFMIIFIVSLMMFGTPMYMLQLNRGDDNAVVESVFGNFWPMNAFYNQYMLSLGEFTIDAFDDNPQTYLCYIFFLVATFLTQITFLNMLITLMGDTFGRVYEAKSQFATMTKLDIMADYTSMIEEVNPEQKTDVYLFIVAPKQSDDSEDPNSAWEGNLSLIKKVLDKSVQNLKLSLEKKINAITTQQMEAKARDSYFDKQNLSQYQRIMDKFEEIDANFERIDNERTDDILETVYRAQRKARTDIKELHEQNELLHEQQGRMGARQASQASDVRNELEQTQATVIEELKELKQSQVAISRRNAAFQAAAADIPPQVSEQAMRSLAETQERVMQQIQALGERHSAFEAAITKSQEAQAEIKQNQEKFNDDVQQYKHAQTEFHNNFRTQMQSLTQQTSATQPDRSGEVINSVQDTLQQVVAQLITQQQQMQETIIQQQTEFKNEVMEQLEVNAQQQQKQQESSPDEF